MLVLTEGTEQFILEGYTSKQLRDMLAKGTVVISFRKVSTEKDRIMYCTRKMSMIPRKHHPNGGGGNIPPGNLAVFDLVKKGWRSFRINRVQKAEPKRLNFLTRLLRNRKYKKDHEVGTNEIELQPNDEVGDNFEPEWQRESFSQSIGLQTPKFVLECFEIENNFKGFYYGQP